MTVHQPCRGRGIGGFDGSHGKSRWKGRGRTKERNQRVLVLRRWFDFLFGVRMCVRTRTVWSRASSIRRREMHVQIRGPHPHPVRSPGDRSRGPPILHPTPTTPLGQSNNRVHTLLLLLGGKHSSPVNFLACLVHVHVCMGVLSTRKHHETTFLHFTSLSLSGVKESCPFDAGRGAWKEWARIRGGGRSPSLHFPRLA